MKKEKRQNVIIILGLVICLGCVMAVKPIKNYIDSRNPSLSITFDPIPYPNPINPEKLRSFIGKPVLEIPIASIFDDQRDLGGRLLHLSSLEDIEAKKMSVKLYDSNFRMKYNLIIENRILKDVIPSKLSQKEREKEMSFRKMTQAK